MASNTFTTRQSISYLIGVVITAVNMPDIKTFAATFGIALIAAVLADRIATND